jgi:4-hydroxy-tetrahydrodipicolinate synthase
MRFRGDPSAIRGSIAPVVTPFTADGELDLNGPRSLIRRQPESGSHGIFWMVAQDLETATGEDHA